jgi:hypothetical protein
MIISVNKHYNRMSAADWWRSNISVRRQNCIQLMGVLWFINIKVYPIGTNTPKPLNPES